MPVGNLLHGSKRDFRCFGDQWPLIAGELQKSLDDGFMDAHHHPLSDIGEQCQPLSESADERRSVGHVTVVGMRHPSQNKPIGSLPFKLPKDVDPQSLPAIVAKNVWALMNASTDLQSQMALSVKAGIGQATVTRILAATRGTRLDNLELIAAAFDLQAWHLLLPGLDPKNPPVVSLTRTERELYERLTKAAKQVSEHHDQRGTAGGSSNSRVTSSD